MDVKKERLAIVQEMIQKQADAISQAMIGTIELVLFESLSKKSNQEIAGKTENCRYVNAPSDESIIGKILPVKITSANRHFLKGIVISDDASC
jgi:tRNA-2-methylthio-N6-dimethylallyladenosine synthase